ncbi:MAG: chemotaxis protein [Desulfuromonas sp.]|nr:MAG: chemotaxis protein [Desulfuromonas sp.]
MKKVNLDSLNKSWMFALIGFALGFFAPIGWILLRLFFFSDPDKSFLQDVFGDMVRTPQSSLLYTYMGFGTAIVFSYFGLIIGRFILQMKDRTEKLDRLNFEIAVQKEKFEQRFQSLNQNLKNFHSINAHIQRSLDIKEILHLSADGLHEILGYDRVNILMIDRQKECLEFVASKGVVGDSPVGLTLPLNEESGAIFKSVDENRMMNIEDVRKLPEEFHIKPPYSDIEALRSRNFVLCPIAVKNEVVGLLGVDNKLRRQLLTDADADTIRLFADQVAAAMTKINLMDGVESLTGELENSFSELLGFRQEHKLVESNLHRANESNIESIGGIANAAGIIQSSVDSTRSSATEISATIEEVNNNLSKLTDFMNSTITSMTQIASTIKSVEENSQQSHDMAETVQRQSGDGVDAVIDNLTGLQGILTSVDETASVINALAGKSEEIGHITVVISEITQKTNLLALNAAIIAAQAGEHGQAFGVVAEEVRSLSQEAADSTNAINNLIAEIQEFTRESVSHVTQTRQLVASGISLGEEVEESLKQISGSSEKSMFMTQEIRKSTKEVARAVESVSEAVESLGDLSAQVTTASQEQSQGIQSIVRSIEEIKLMADDMADATDGQKKTSREIDEAVRSVSEMAQRIFDEMENRQKESRDVIERLEELKRDSSDY